MRRHGMMSGRGPLARLIAALAVVAVIGSVGYSALATIGAPTWASALLVVLLLGLPLWAFFSGPDRE